MAIYRTDEDYDLIVAVFNNRVKADEFLEVMKSHESRGAIKIKEAATMTREDSGKIRLNNKGYVAGWKGGTIGLGLGILLGGPIGGAAIGGLIGFLRSKDRRELRDKVNEKLGQEESAIALMLGDPIDWDLLSEMGQAFDAELLHAELRGESMTKVEELSEDEDVQRAIEEEFDEVVAE
jgi:uncharacterized membrane protein